MNKEALKEAQKKLKEQRQYVKDIKQYMENASSTYECEQILGTKKEVNELAQVWKKNKERFMLVESVLLKNFCETEIFTSQELSRFRIGLSMINNFLSSCEAEIEVYEENKKQKKDLT